MEKIKIRDLRHKEKFQIDDEYLNGQAKLCGIYATGVYVSLCRHSDKEQQCFPSIRLIAEELKISRDSVIKGLRQLEKHQVVLTIKQKKNKTGKFLNNTYFLVDKKYWINNQVADNDTDRVVHSPIPSRSQRLTRVADTDCKDTHKKDTHIRVKALNKLKAELIRKRIIK